MEVLLNELSVNQQYTSIEDFLDNGLNVMLPILKGFSDEVSICKSYNLYEREVTNGLTLHNILVADYSRTIDEIKRYKIFFSKFFQNPYWEDNPYQSKEVIYLHNQQNVSGTSIAEASERDQVLLSFNNGGFNNNSLEVTKEAITINVINLINNNDLEDFLRDDESILNNEIRFRRTSLFRQGKTVYQEISSNNYWYLDNLHRDHYEVFNPNREHLGTANMEGTMISNAINGRKL